MSVEKDFSSQSNTLSSNHKESIIPREIKSTESLENKSPIVPAENNPQTPNQKTTNSSSDIDTSKKTVEASTVTTSESSTEISSHIITAINQAADTLKNVNVIKDELCKLPIDICETEYITNSILPMLTILNQFANITYGIANGVSSLNVSPLVSPDKSELKDAIHLCYKVLDQAEDVYDVLKKRINLLIKKN
jgi:hypothetical protein